jgi:anti-sigma factor RsiW
MKVRDREIGCEHYAELFTGYLDRSLPANVERDLAEHLDGCPGCRERLDGMRELVERLARLGEAEASPELAWMIKRVIHREAAGRRQPGGIRLFPFLASAMATAAVLVAVSLSLPETGDPAPGKSGTGLEASTVQQAPLEHFVLPPRLGDRLQAAEAQATASGLDTARTPALRFTVPVRFQF